MDRRIREFVKTGEIILKGSPVYADIHEIVAETSPLVEELNKGGHGKDEARKLLEKITGQSLDSSTEITLPFRTDFGRHIVIGKDVFINTDVMMTDLGGITIEDKVLIAPRVTILTVNHPTDPKTRRSLILKPVHIKQNAWIGAGATILPGVTIGENAIVAAGSVVSKNVPDNCIVAGVPSKIIKEIDARD